MKQTAPVEILGVKLHPLDVPALHACIKGIIDSDEKAVISHVNVHALNYAHQLPWFKDFLNNSSIVFCDGSGVILGAKILGYKIPQRITYADWMWQLAEFAAANGYTLFLLGGHPSVASKAAEKLALRFNNLKIVGTQHGYFDKDINSLENSSVVETINTANAHILVVGFGMPLQEKWILENRDSLNVNIALTAGAVFDYISGDLRRGPKWMTNNHFEWLARLIIEPRRLWKRYILGNPLFLLRIFRKRLYMFFDH